MYIKQLLTRQAQCRRNLDTYRLSPVDREALVESDGPEVVDLARCYHGCGVRRPCIPVAICPREVHPLWIRRKRVISSYSPHRHPGDAVDAAVVDVGNEQHVGHRRLGA